MLLIITVLVVVVVTAIGSGRLGRLLEAMADSPLALETQGATSSVLEGDRVLHHRGDGVAGRGADRDAVPLRAWAPTSSRSTRLILVAIVVIITIGEPWYAVLGAVGYTVIPGYITGANTTNCVEVAVRGGRGHRGLRHPAAVPLRWSFGTFLDRIGRPQAGPS